MERIRWIRPALVLLAAPNLVAGIWAMVSPRSWFEDFPAWGPRLVAAILPYNEHLATDAGAGLLATGTAAALAAWWLRRDVVVVAMCTYLVFALPHAVFHLAHPTESLSTAADTVNAATLVAAAVMASAVLVRAVAAPAVHRPPSAE